MRYFNIFVTFLKCYSTFTKENYVLRKPIKRHVRPATLKILYVFLISREKKIFKKKLRKCPNYF